MKSRPCSLRLMVRLRSDQMKRMHDCSYRADRWQGHNVRPDDIDKAV